MIVVTGGAGFVGSAVVWHLNGQGHERIIVVDRLGSSDKWKNLVKLRFDDYVPKDAFLAGLEKGAFGSIEAIVHLGACSDTTESDADYLYANNYVYTRKLAELAVGRGIRLVVASSAATYGDGSLGFDDDPTSLHRLRPLNMYAYSKHLFDLWALRNGLLDKVAVVKLFNVFGPNEYHKGPMRSMVHKAFEQVRQDGVVRLFRSCDPAVGHGEQQRDFVYVKDCAAALAWLAENRQVNGLFNLGSGTARTWNDLARAVFAAMGRTMRIEYIDMPAALQRAYQNYTCAVMQRLAATGCPVPSTALEQAVADYVGNYLMGEDPYL